MTNLAGRKPILCLDFDGVCHSYTSGWKGADVIPDPPVDGLFEFLMQAIEVFEVNIFSSRSNQEGGLHEMKQWFRWHYQKWAEEHGHWQGWDRQNLMDFLKFPTDKPPAFVGIDDRVVTFTGQWPTVESLRNFKTWNAKQV